MKNPHMFQSVLISLFLLIGVSSYSKNLPIIENRSGITLNTTVTSFSPAEGVAGTVITIIGTDFTNSSVVKIGTDIIPSANIIFISATQLKVTIPCGVTSGLIEVDGVASTTIFTYKQTLVSNVLPNLS